MKIPIKDNKVLIAITTIILGLLISWGVWATTSIFHQEGKQSMGMERDFIMQKSVEEIKTDVGDFKKEVKQEFDHIQRKIDRNQDKVIDILMGLDRRQKSMMEKIEK